MAGVTHEKNSGWSQRNGEQKKKAGKGRTHEKERDEEIKKDRTEKNALKQMVTFAKMDLFTNKCPRCQHLLQTDLHNVTELTALICSSLCQHKSYQLNRQHEPCFCFVCRCVEPFHLPASSHVHLITISRNHVRLKRSTL